MNIVQTPIGNDVINSLKVGDVIYISGEIYCGRDAVLPRIVKSVESGKITEMGISLEGSVIFHTAVSVAGVGPTSSNKLEIESSMEPLSKAGVKIHLGKGRISRETVEMLSREGSVYAVIPPVTALLNDRVLEQEPVAFPELGMEAFYRLRVDAFPAIIAVANGREIYA